MHYSARVGPQTEVAYVDQLRHARSFLFVPGDRPERFDKALASGADIVVLDLEDAVAAKEKDQARINVATWLRRGHQAVVRINSAGTPWFEADVLAFSGLAEALMLPKAEAESDIERLPDDVAVIPLIETSIGVVAAAEVCRARGVVRAAFGSIDLATELGIEHTARVSLRHARSAIVLACAAAGLPGPVDGVTTAFEDPASLLDDLAEARGLGFTGKLCIHPRQISIVQERLAPSDAEIRWARAVVARSADGAATSLDGQMIDRPVLLRAQALLERADLPSHSR
ncbi:HpcH/HpaI aldolase/citrate lyase family protein [Nocardia africana]|uniref:HpcH/HpaI aldolase/citrate lyase family protein n=1 Tax=Nocardia africana TaxID=134964 RepID=A0ABW6NTY4_9NOCA